MSDHSQLAKTGAGLGGVVVIGGLSIQGYILLAITFVIVGIGAVAARFAFRPHRDHSQR
ncbi:hypothetical protein ACFZAM_31600 [Streptomyces sp. NPDC008079]|uniref:hypothetical protein n=1 Tax=Streptomyces sp. NPDC008079 TaxID=3364806 RepID=UPI0036E22A40